MRVVDKSPAGRFVSRAGGAIGMVPVHQRVIETDAQAFGSRRVYVFLYQIAPGALLYGVVARQFCVPQAEAFMMLGGHHHVLLPRRLGQPSELAWSIGPR